MIRVTRAAAIAIAAGTALVGAACTAESTDDDPVGQAESAVVADKQEPSGDDGDGTDTEGDTDTDTDTEGDAQDASGDDDATGADDPAAPQATLVFEPPAPGAAPADRDEWIGYLLTVQGPVTDFADPFAPLDFFPDGIPTPPDAGLVLYDLDFAADDPVDRDGFITYPGIDTVSLAARLDTSLTLEEFEAFYDAAHPEGDAWAQSAKNLREQSDDQVLTYVFERDLGDAEGPDPSYQVDAFENGETGEVDLSFRLTYFNAESTPYDRMTTMASDLPTLDNAKRTRYSVLVNQFGVTLFVTSNAEGLPEAVADDLASRFPSGTYGPASAPEFNDTLESYAVDVACGENLQCAYTVLENSQFDGESNVSFQSTHTTI